MCINWEDAKAYANWLSRKTGKSYRLLSEAEYEYAARARTQSTWIWGEDGNGSCRYGNIGDQTTKNSVPGWNWTPAQCNDGYGYTAPIKRFQANGFGLYDMTGNTWSWVQDCGNDSYNGAPGNGDAWTSGNCGQRVLRGGSWFNIPQYARVAYRSTNNPALRFNNIGFRLARTKD